jgi:hypothetical protein
MAVFVLAETCESLDSQTHKRPKNLSGEQFMSSRTSAATEQNREKMSKQVNLVFPLISKIFERSMTDSEFRQLVLSDPDRAIKAIGGEALPTHVKLAFYDNSGEAKTIPYVLPDPLPVAELSDADLEHVAGGLSSDSSIDNVNTGCCLTV